MKRAAIIPLVALPFWLLHAAQTPLNDEAIVYATARQVARTGSPTQPDGEKGAWHVPTYLYLAAASMRAFGESPTAARLVGMACFVGTTLVVAWTAGRLTSPGWGLTAALAYAIQPLAIQGALLIDWDNTVLTLATAAFFGVLAVQGPPSNARSAAGTAALMAALLLAKESALSSTLPIVVLWLWGRRADRRAWGWTALALAAGTAVAAALYGATCAATGFPFAAPFEHNAVHLRGFLGWPPGGEWLVQRARFAAAWAAWIGPPAAMLLLWPLAGALRTLGPRARPADGADLLMLAGGAIAAAYLLINGAVWWFPRYECPALPLLVTGAVAWAARRWEAPMARPAFLLGAGATLLAALLGDLADLSHASLKRAALEDASGPAVWMLAARFSLALAPLAVAAATRRWTAAFPAMLIGPALALNLLQVPREQTTYGYGITGARAMLDRLGALPPGSRIMGPHEAVVLTAAEPVLTTERDFDHPARFAAIAGDPACRAVVLSLGRNSLAHLRLAPPVRALLEQEYVLERVGDYWIWRRRPAARSP